MDSETIKGNDLIAKFLGFTLERCNNGIAWNGHNKEDLKDKPYKLHGVLYGHATLRFHTSWDWLMPVVLKIMNTKYPLLHAEAFKSDIAFVAGRANMHETWHSVVQFIKWYNSQPNSY